MTSLQVLTAQITKHKNQPDPQEAEMEQNASATMAGTPLSDNLNSDETETGTNVENDETLWNREFQGQDLTLAELEEQLQACFRWAVRESKLLFLLTRNSFVLAVLTPILL